MTTHHSVSSHILPPPILFLFLFHLVRPHLSHLFFFFNDTATTEIYTLSLHDALPISETELASDANKILIPALSTSKTRVLPDRKSTRLNSSHVRISYAVFCLKKKKKDNYTDFFI